MDILNIHFVTNRDIITLLRISIMLEIGGDNGDGIGVLHRHNTKIFFLLS